MKIQPRNNKKGFTTVELVIVIAVICVLFVVLTVQASAQVNKSKEAGVETDFHSYYIGAKSAITIGDKPALSSKANFVNLMNEYIDDEIEVDETSDNLRLMKKNDPWNNRYEFIWKDRDNATTGKHEYWLAFVSKGSNPLQNWVHEPEKQVSTQEQKYSVPAAARTNADGTVYNYIELIGYFDTGVTIDGMTDANNDGSIEDDLAWMFSDVSDITTPGSGSGTGGSGTPGTGGSGTGGSGTGGSSEPGTGGGSGEPSTGSGESGGNTGSTSEPVVKLSDWTFEVSGDRATIRAYNGEMNDTVDLVIPSDDGEGHITNGLDKYLFSDRTIPFIDQTFKSVTVPGSFSCGSDLFKNVTAETITIAKNGEIRSFDLKSGSFAGINVKNLYVGKSAADAIADDYGNAAMVPQDYDNVSTSPFWTSGLNSSIENIEIHSNINAGLFKNCGVKTVDIGSEVTIIGREAFAGNNELTVVRIHNTEGAVNIYPDAFPEGVTIIYDGGTTGGGTGSGSGSTGSESGSENDIVVSITDFKFNNTTVYPYKSLIVGYKGPSGANVILEIPSLGDTGLSVSDIAYPDTGYTGIDADYESFENKTFKSVIIPGGVNVDNTDFNNITANSVEIAKTDYIGYIGGQAFNGSKIKNLYIGETNSINLKESYNYRLAPLAYEIANIPSEASSDYNAFYSSTNPSIIENIEIHSNIPALLFKNCSVKSVKIGSEVKIIGEQAFIGNNDLALSSGNKNAPTVIIDNNFDDVTIKNNAFPVGTVVQFNDSIRECYGTYFAILW